MLVVVLERKSVRKWFGALVPMWALVLVDLSVGALVPMWALVSAVQRTLTGQHSARSHHRICCIAECQYSGSRQSGTHQVDTSRTDTSKCPAYLDRSTLPRMSAVRTPHTRYELHWPCTSPDNLCTPRHHRVSMFHIHMASKCLCACWDIHRVRNRKAPQALEVMWVAVLGPVSVAMFLHTLFPRS